MTVNEQKRNVVIVRNVHSDIISEAYFILKSDIHENEESISAEAERILREFNERTKKTRHILPPSLASFLAGTGICAFIVSVLILCIQFAM